MKRFIKEYAVDIIRSLKSYPLFPRDEIAEKEIQINRILHQVERGMLTTDDAVYLLLTVSSPERF